MPTVVAVLNQKGGSGKTTIATNLAHALHRQDQRVLLIDADPQGSARDWNEANGGTLLPVIGLDRETLPKDLAAVSNGYDWIVIDGAPQVVKMSAAAVKAADIVLIPVQPSPYDIWACADLVDIIKARQDMTGGKPKSAFVVSRVIKNTRLSGEVTAALADYGLPVFKSLTTQRVLYPTTAATGHTVFTRSNNGAAGEIDAIKDELMVFADA
jgi:chromosome partitioning protein